MLICNINQEKGRHYKMLSKDSLGESKVNVELAKTIFNLKGLLTPMHL